MRPAQQHREPGPELRDEALAWQQILHLVHLRMANLADRTCDRLGHNAPRAHHRARQWRRKIRQALDDVLDRRQGKYGHTASVRHPADRLERANRAFKPAQ